MDYKKHLAVLGFSPLSQPKGEELKKAWKDLCKKHHPDKGGDPEKFREATHSYQMLVNPEYRHQEKEREKRAGKDNMDKDLDVTVQVPASFDDVFFGKTININTNQLELDEEYNPIIKDTLDLVSVVIQLPAGCFNGYQKVEVGKGHCRGGVKGDLRIQVVIIPHKTFRVAGADIVYHADIPLDLMLKGGELEVPTMYGTKTIRIPPGTAPGAEISIPKVGINRVGNQRVIVKPLFPSRDELKSEKWKGLDIDWNQGPEVKDEEAEEFHNLFINVNNNQYSVRGFTPFK